MPQKSGLGRGLGALIPGGDNAIADNGIMLVPVELVLPNPRQPRNMMHPEELGELTASIREHGVLQPLIVTPGDTQGRYILIAGERRLQAARMAGLASVPVLVRQATDQQRLELAIIENVQRSDLSALEEAEAYRQLAEDFDLSHEEIAARVGKSRVAVTNTLRLLKLPDTIKNALIEGRISEGHARALLALPTPEAQSAALHTVIAQELNVRQTEELVRKLSGEKPPRKPKPAPVPEVAALEERLRASLGTKVTLRSARKGGTVTIHYYSNEELDALLGRLLNE
ncbi:MAG TPA: ParB/RepB/Spo0J family partition protein [Anaerolineales bacterium]|nr:ParB/RepB/Spo0J family partition protein [Anaerolineales bacterium]